MKDATHQEAIDYLRHSVPNVTLRVYRHKDEKKNNQISELNVELVKKAGKGLGLSIVGINNSKGVYISEIVSVPIFIAKSRIIFLNVSTSL